MSDSKDSVDRSSADESDWIKGLVAQALIRAAEDETVAERAAEPRQVSPPTTPNVPPAENRPTPPPVEPVSIDPVPPPTRIEPPKPALPPRPDGGDARPLVIGRGVQGSDAADAVDGAERPEPAVIPPPAAAATMTSLKGAPTEQDLPPRIAAPHEAPPEQPSEGPSLFDQAADRQEPREQVEPARTQAGPDDVMVEEHVTTEGFRSSDIRTVLEWLAVIVSALAVALVIKAFVLQAFYIPSESMETTVNEGDRILVNKVSYRLHDVRRGDLVVFKKVPGTASATDDLIKRAIALPGETIEVRADGRIWIWGPGESAADALLLEEPYLDPQNEALAPPSATDPLTVDVWDDSCVNQPRTPGRCTLGADQYFMMGDNRGQSSDSRFFGPITEDLIVGRAFLRIWPLGEISSL